MEESSYKREAIRPLISIVPNNSNNASTDGKVRMDPLATFFYGHYIDKPALSDQQKLSSLVLCGHLMPLRVLTKINDWERERDRVRERKKGIHFDDDLSYYLHPYFWDILKNVSNIGMLKISACWSLLRYFIPKGLGITLIVLWYLHFLRNCFHEDSFCIQFSRIWIFHSLFGLCQILSLRSERT